MSSQKVEIPSNRPPLTLECLEERIAPAGNIIAVVSGGNLTITGDADANEFAIEPWLDPDSLFIIPTSGTTINGGATSVVLTGITGGIKMNLGDGNDAVSLHGVEVAKNLQINAGAGTDSLETDGYVRIGGSLTLSDVEHSDLADLRLARNMTITYTTDGQNTVNMSNGIVGGNVSITNRGQDIFSDFEFDGVEIAGRLTVSNKTGTHGFGDASTLSIHDCLVGGVQVKGGTGDYSFEFVDSETIQGKGGISLSYGVGDVTALIDNSTVYGSVALKTAGGLAAMAYETAVIFQNGSDIYGNLNVRTFDTDDVLILDGVYVVKGVNINTGTGDSTVAMNNSTIGLELVNNKLKTYNSTIAQTISGWGFGGDTTTVSLNHIEIGQLHLNLRPQDAHVSFEHVETGGNVSVNTQGGNDVLVFDGFAPGLNFSVKTAGGDDLIYFDDIVTFDGAFSIDAGAGNDTVRMDRLTEDVVSRYGGPVKILLGSGDDFLQMGNPAASGNRGWYHGPVLVNGGAGADELFYLANGNIFDYAPKIVLFENVH